MACSGQRDEFYNDHTFCPIPENVFQVMASVNIGLYCWICIFCVPLNLVLEWKREHKFTPLFKAVLLGYVGLTMVLPVLATRAYYPDMIVLEQHWALAPCFVIGFVMFLRGCTKYMLGCIVLTVMRYALALDPAQADAWDQRVSRIQNILSVMETASFSGLMLLGMDLSPMGFSAVIFSFSLGLSLFGAVVGLSLLFAVHQVQAAIKTLPEETPPRFRKELRIIRGFLWVLCAECLLGVMVPSFVMGVVPWAQKNSGFLLCFVVFPVAQGAVATLLSIEALMNIRRLRRAKVVLNSWKKRQQRRRDSSIRTPMRQVIARGVRRLADPSSSVNISPPALARVWERGLSMEFLERFLESSVLRLGRTTISTCGVVEQYVKPWTQPARCSVWEALFVSAIPSSGASGGLSHMEPDVEETFTGTPTVMVSHAWSYEFSLLLSIIRNYVTRMELPHRVYFFIDLFSMNQHDLAEVQHGPQHAIGRNSSIFETLLDNLRKSITTPGTMLMALDPWTGPTSFTRCWCLYEIYIAHITGTNVIMAFSEESEEEFMLYLRSSKDAVKALVDNVDAAKAEATVDKDREMILELLNQIGIQKFNDTIRNKLTSTLRLTSLSSIVGNTRLPPTIRNTFNHIESDAFERRCLRDAYWHIVGGDGSIQVSDTVSTDGDSQVQREVEIDVVEESFVLSEEIDAVEESFVLSEEIDAVEECSVLTEPTFRIFL